MGPRPEGVRRIVPPNAVEALNQIKEDDAEAGLKQWNDEIRIKSQDSELVRDPLTGVANLREFVSQLEQSIKLVRRGIPSSLLYIDIDHFKKVNDTFGHPKGDVVLKEVAAYLRRSVRESDVVARIGGEEFAVILSGSNGFSEQKAEKIRIGITELKFEECKDLVVTVSLGVISLQESMKPEAARLLADKALYKAKNTGRNKVVAA